MGCGVTRGRDSRASSGMLLLDVQVDDFFRVFLDVLPARFDGLAHQDREEGIGGRRILNRHLLQDPARGIHGRLPEFIRVHLAQALVALVGNSLVAESLRQFFPLLLRVRIVELLALLDLVQGWLRDVDVAAIEERPHVSEEQGEQERRDVLAIHVRVGHRDDFVIPHFLCVELLADARADRRDERADLLVLQHLIHPGLLDIQDLPAEREDRLELPAASLLRGPPGRRTFHDEQLALRGIPLLAVRQLPGKVESFEQPLPSGQLPRFPCGFSGLGGEDRLPDADFRDLRGLVEEVREFLVHDRLDDSLDLRVSELHLRLTFELRFGDFQAQDRRQAFPDVVALEAFAALDVLVVLRILDERPGETRLEAGEVRASLDRVDVVDEREDRFVVAVVVLHRHFDQGPVGFLRETDRVRVQRRLRAVDPLHVFGDATLELEYVPAAVDLVHDDDPKARVEECELTESRRECVVLELDGLEDFWIRPERDDRSRPFRRSDDLELGGLLSSFEPHPVLLAFSAHADLKRLAQTVDDGESDAVEAAGDAVHLVFELAARVHPRQDKFDTGNAVFRVEVDWNPPAVVGDGHAPVLIQRDLDFLTKAGHGFVDRIVDDFMREVVQAPVVNRPDIHRRPLSDRLEALQNLDLLGVVGGLFYHLFRNLRKWVGRPSRNPSRTMLRVYGGSL